MIKKNVSLFIVGVSLFCLLCFDVLLLNTSGDESAEFSDVKTLTSSNVAVKIPPPIEGVFIKEQYTAQALVKENISILGADGSYNNFEVEVAKTSEEQRIGMMFRKYIDEGTGMLFLFKKEEERNFWMKNTLIPLDLIFIRHDGVIHHIHPMAEEKSLDRIPSNGAVAAVLEIAGGAAEILGINVGDHILYSAFLTSER